MAPYYESLNDQGIVKFENYKVEQQNAGKWKAQSIFHNHAYQVNFCIHMKKELVWFVHTHNLHFDVDFWYARRVLPSLEWKISHKVHI